MLQTTSTVVEVCLYAKLPRGDQEKLEFLSCFQMVGVLFFLLTDFLYFFNIIFFCVHYVNVWARQISYHCSS